MLFEMRTQGILPRGKVWPQDTTTPEILAPPPSRALVSACWCSTSLLVLMWALMVIEMCWQVLWEFLRVTFLSLLPFLKSASGVLNEPQVESQGHLDLGRTILPNDI